jgi:hypothetical protein
MAILTSLCQLNGGCMGCCGHDFESAQKIKLAIDLNTKELENHPDLIEFRDRVHSRDLRYGVCRNLVCKDKQLLCPLHPKLNNNKDLRVGHCNINYLCNAAKAYQDWPQEKQQKFLEFIKKQNLDNITYSIKMDNNSMLEEFNSLYK